MGAVRVARDLSLLPGIEVGVEVLERRRGPALKPGDLLGDSAGIARLGEGAQFLDLGLDLGDRLFEVEIAAHQASDGSAAVARNKPARWPKSSKAVHRPDGRQTGPPLSPHEWERQTRKKRVTSVRLGITRECLDATAP